MRFSLEVGLVVRDGKRSLEFSRELDDGDVQLEDLATRRPIIMKAHTLIERIVNGRYVLATGKSNIWSDGEKSRTPITSLAALPEAQRKLVEYRYSYVKALRTCGVTRGQRQEVGKCISSMSLVLNDENPPSSSTVMQWARKYAKNDENPISLIDGRAFRKATKQISETMEAAITEELKRSYLTKSDYSLQHAHNQLTLRLARMKAEGLIDIGTANVSYSTLNRRVHEIDLYHRVAARSGVSRARHVTRTTFPGGYPTAPMEQVEIDHTVLNWVVICERSGLPLGRPTLTVMVDGYSGYLLGFYISFYGAGLTSLAGVIRNAVMPKEEMIKGWGLKNRWLSHGVGDEWVVDNGAEFHSFGFKQMAMSLGVDIKYSRARTPWIKPHVERFFGALNSLTLTPGRVHKPQVNSVRPDPYKEATVAFGDLVEGLTQFFVDVYPFQFNKRKSSTPYELFKSGLERCPPASYPGSMDELRLAAAISEERTLGPGGIEVLGLPYGSFDFGRLMKKHGRQRVLTKLDPDDMARLYVLDPDSKSWFSAECRWQDYARGLSLAQHKLIRKHAREDLKTSGRIDDLLIARERLHEHWKGVTGKRKRAGAVLAGRYANITSANVEGTVPNIALQQTSHDVESFKDPINAASSRLIGSEDHTADDGSIPDFESFSLRRTIGG